MEIIFDQQKKIEPMVRVSLYLTKSLRDRLERIKKVEFQPLNQVCKVILESGADEWEAEHKLDEGCENAYLYDND